MDYVKKICGYITFVNKSVGGFVSYSVYLIFLLLIAEVVMRYFFRQPTTWTGELSQLIFGAYVMLSGAFLLANRGHVNVDIFIRKVSPRMQGFLSVITSFLFFVFVLVLIVEGWDMAYESMSRMEKSGSAWNPHVWPAKLAIPLGAGLLLLQGFSNLLEDIINLVTKASK